jgi:hypothetical protein
VRRFDEEVELRRGVMADDCRDIRAGGGDDSLLAVDHLRLRHAQSIAAEVDTDRIALGREKGLDEAEHFLSNPARPQIAARSLAARLTYDSLIDEANCEDWRM